MTNSGIGKPKRQVFDTKQTSAFCDGNGCLGRGLVSEQSSGTAAALCYQPFSTRRAEGRHRVGLRQSSLRKHGQKAASEIPPPGSGRSPLDTNDPIETFNLS